jgi:hypothetical protein
MTQQSRAEAGAATEAIAIQLSRHEPEQFTVVFRRHAPYIQLGDTNPAASREESQS